MSNDDAPPDLFPQEDYARLSELLDLQSDLSLDGAIGLLHAIAVAPSIIPDETWLPKVLKDNHASGGTALARYCIELLIRLKAEVQDALEHDQMITPDSGDVDECADFAAGYVAGAELDPLWRDDASRWTFASGLAYLSDRLDVVPQHTLREIEENLAPHPKEILRGHLGALVRAAAESFKGVRNGDPQRDPRVSIAQKLPRINKLNAADGRDLRAVQQQVGRNDPCPCGSGSKFKRCCMQ